MFLGFNLKEKQGFYVKYLTKNDEQQIDCLLFTANKWLKFQFVWKNHKVLGKQSSLLYACLLFILNSDRPVL